MLHAERVEAGLPVGTQPEAHHAVVHIILPALDHPERLGTADEFGCAVMPQQQMVGDVAHRGSIVAAMTPDGEQQLVLRRRQTHLTGLLLAPTEEAAKAIAELEQFGVIRSWSDK